MQIDNITLIERPFDNWTIDDIREQIISFKNDTNYQRLKAFYKSRSYAEILGVERRELSHSNFLAWLLDYRADHRLGDTPLRRFLDLLVSNSHSTNDESTNELYNMIVSEDINVTNYDVYREYTLHNNEQITDVKNKKKTKRKPSNGRLDLLIDIQYQKDDDIIGNLKIVIENKVASKEGPDQTNRYYEYFQQQKETNEFLDVLYVFLVPYTTYFIIESDEKKKRLCENENFIIVTYQDIVNDVIEKLYNERLNERTAFILKDYVNTLSQPALNKNKENKGKELIMALGQEEKELLKQFWTKNEELILAALYAIKTSDDTDYKLVGQIDEQISALRNTVIKDKTTYRILYQDNVIYDNFIKADIGLRTLQTLHKFGLASENLAFLKGDKSCSHELIKEKSEVSKTEKKYNRYRIKGKPEIFIDDIGYYIARNWGVNATKNFIDKISSKFPDISFEEVDI